MAALLSDDVIPGTHEESRVCRCRRKKYDKGLIPFYSVTVLVLCMHSDFLLALEKLKTCINHSAYSCVKISVDACLSPYVDLLCDLH